MANPNPSPSTRFRRGDRANPGGRPQGRSVSARLRELLDAKAPKGHGKGQAADAVARVILEAALGGDFRFVKELLDRTEGKVPDKVQQEHKFPDNVVVLPPNGRDGTAPAEDDPPPAGAAASLPIESG